MLANARIGQAFLGSLRSPRKTKPTPRAWARLRGPLTIGRCCLTLELGHATSSCPIHEEPALTRSEIWRLEKYLRNLFRLDTITIVERPKQPDSVEVQVNGEFVGVLFKDEEDGEISYAFNMAILEMDLPPAPASRA